MTADETQSLELLGLFYGPYNTAKDAEDPQTELTINKSDLTKLGASGTFISRIAWKNTGGYTQAEVVASATIDGVAVKTKFGGMNISTQGQAGTLDCPIFDYPNTNKAMKPGKHLAEIIMGTRHGVLGGQHTFGIGFPETYWMPKKTITINILDA